MALKRIRKEIQAIQDDLRSSGIQCGCLGGDEWNLHATISVIDAESPYSGGIFLLSIQFPRDYPFKPPKVRFITPVYHPFINSAGVMCIDMLRDQWSPACTVAKVLLNMQSFLSDFKADLGNPFVPNIAQLFMNDHRQFQSTVRKWMQRHCESPVLGPGVPVTQSYYMHIRATSHLDPFPVYEIDDPNSESCLRSAVAVSGPVQTAELPATTAVFYGSLEVPSSLRRQEILRQELSQAVADHAALVRVVHDAEHWPWQSNVVYDEHQKDNIDYYKGQGMDNHDAEGCVWFWSFYTAASGSLDGLLDYGSRSGDNAASLYFRSFNSKGLIDGTVPTEGNRITMWYMKQALLHAPPYIGHAVRGCNLRADELASMLPGSVITWKHFASATKGTSVASGWEHTNCRFILWARGAKYIAKFSSVPSEDEVLFLPKTHLLILRREIVGGPPFPVYHIYAREILNETTDVLGVVPFFPSDYAIVKKLTEEGNNSLVFKIKVPKKPAPLYPQRELVLKVVSNFDDRSSRSSVLVGKFGKEWKSIAKLPQHDSLVPILHHYHAEQTPDIVSHLPEIWKGVAATLQSVPRTLFIVLPLYPAGSLRQYVKNNHPQDWTWWRCALKRMLSAVAFLRDHGAVHGDLKDDQFLLRGEGISADLVLSDFGETWFFKNDDNEDRIFHSRQDQIEVYRAGPGSFKAPEVRGRTLAVGTSGKYLTVEDVYDKAEAWSVGYTFLSLKNEIHHDGSNIFHRLDNTFLENERRREQGIISPYPDVKPRQPFWRYSDAEVPALATWPSDLRDAVQGLLRCDCGRLTQDRHGCDCTLRWSARKALNHVVSLQPNPSYQ